MAKEASVFGSVADQETTQIMIDTRLEKFNQPWYSKYFSFALPQISLTYTAVLGNSVITPAASFVTRDGETPLRSRETLQSLTGKIPPIKVMRDLDEEKYRNYMVLQDMKAIKDNEKKNQALKLIWDDLKYVTEAVDKRLDYTVAEAISTGTITITADNNPDGIVVGTIELEMPAENKVNASVDWSNSVNSKPITDITNLVNGAYGKGKTFAKMLIDNTAFLQFMQSKEVKETVGTFFGLSAAARNSQTAPLTSDRINEYMVAAKLPIFEIVDVRVPIEKDGNVSILQPFKAANIAFVPDGNLGEIKNALAMEEMKPVEHVTYNKKGRTLISKWSANEPWGEWTKAELNAFPVVDTIKYIYLLSTTGDF